MGKRLIYIALAVGLLAAPSPIATPEVVLATIHVAPPSAESLQRRRLSNAITSVGVDSTVAEEWAEIFWRYGEQTGVSSEILIAIAYKESDLIETAYNPDDPSWGLMQVMPKWWQYSFVEKCGVEGTPENLVIAEHGICYGAHVFKHFLTKFDGDVTKALSGYNTGRPIRTVYSRRVNEVRSELFF